MNLALALGVRDPREFRYWPAVVVGLWLTYFGVQPYGNLATDIREGIASMRSIAIQADQKSKNKIKLSDYILGETARSFVVKDDNDGLPTYQGGGSSDGMDTY